MKTIKGVKAFEKGLKCKGFQFEENKEFVHKGELKICKSGFHFCENPLDTLDYYDLCNSDFAEVEAIGETENHNNDSKITTNKLKIGLKIDLKRFIELSFEYIWNKTKDKASGNNSKLATSGDYSKLATSGNNSKLATSGNNSKLATSGYNSQLATSGNNSKLATSGYNSKLATSGYNSQLATSGYNSKLATSGYNSQLATSGDYSQLATSGDYSKLATSGYNSKLATSGYNSQLATSGDYSQLEINGQNSVGANIGVNGIIKGKIGTWITLAEYDCQGKCLCVKSAKIDGKKIKEDVWYKLENGKFTEH